MGTINHDTLLIYCYDDHWHDISNMWCKYQYDNVDEYKTTGLWHMYDLPVNGGKMIHLGSCGSKNGWGTAEALRECYERICNFMDGENRKKFRYSYTWVQFGDEPPRVVRSK
jgi:hypothetical protein